MLIYQKSLNPLAISITFARVFSEAEGGDGPCDTEDGHSPQPGLGEGKVFYW